MSEIYNGFCFGLGLAGVVVAYFLILAAIAIMSEM